MVKPLQPGKVLVLEAWTACTLPAPLRAVLQGVGYSPQWSIKISAEGCSQKFYKVISAFTGGEAKCGLVKVHRHSIIFISSCGFIQKDLKDAILRRMFLEWDTSDNVL